MPRTCGRRLEKPPVRLCGASRPSEPSRLAEETKAEKGEGGKGTDAFSRRKTERKWRGKGTDAFSRRKRGRKWEPQRKKPQPFGWGNEIGANNEIGATKSAKSGRNRGQRPL